MLCKKEEISSYVRDNAVSGGATVHRSVHKYLSSSMLADWLTDILDRSLGHSDIGEIKLFHP